MNPRWSGVLVVDLDRLTAVNETWGRAAGDAVLAATAAAVRADLPAGSEVHHADDEFVVLLSGPVGPRTVGAVAETIRRRVAGLRVPVDGPDGARAVAGAPAAVGVTASVGAVADPTGRAEPAVLLWSADSALHTAKRSGRDAVHVVVAGAGTGRAPRAAPRGPG